MTMIPDVQNSQDTRNMPINQVGIKDLRFPIRIKTETEQHTVAHFAMTVFLPAEKKGTHMSRFVTLLEENAQAAFDFDFVKTLTEQMLVRLNTDSGKISVSFPFFRTKYAPVTKMTSLLDYDVSITSEIKKGVFSGCLKILIPVTSLCPCSKEISQYGAHNQRSHITLTLHTNELISIEQVIDLVEQQGSAQLYGLLKRPDEKFVTEQAYDNPKFVEDIVRDVAIALRNHTNITSFLVESENFESIHNHSAYACISYP